MTMITINPEILDRDTIIKMFDVMIAANNKAAAKVAALIAALESAQPAPAEATNLFAIIPTGPVGEYELRMATPAQVRAEYERLFREEVKRAKVAEALLTAVLADNAVDDYDLAASHIQDFLDYLEKDDMSLAEFADVWFSMLKGMAAVLEAADG